MGEENEPTNEGDDTGETPNTISEEPKIPTNAEPKKSLYKHTNEATERLEKANAKKEELLNREEELYEKRQLGGMTEAGQQTQVDPSKKISDEIVGAFN